MALAGSKVVLWTSTLPLGWLRNGAYSCPLKPHLDFARQFTLCILPERQEQLVILHKPGKLGCLGFATKK